MFNFHQQEHTIRTIDYWIDYKKSIAYCIYEIVNMKDKEKESNLRFQESKYYANSSNKLQF